MDNDFEYWDDDDRREYNDSYMKAMSDLTQNLDDDQRDALLQEMQTIRYNPTTQAAQDAELNLLRSKKILSDRKRGMGPAVDSFLKFKARADGKSLSATTKWASKALKGE